MGSVHAQDQGATGSLKPLEDGNRSIAITQIVEHPSLDAIRDGIVEGLAEEGWVKDKNLTVTWDTAQGSFATAAQIATRAVGMHPDVIVAISTPSAQTAVSAADGKIPVIFSGVTDPVGARLVKSLDNPGGLVTGTSDKLKPEPQLDMMVRAIPTLKRLGFMYNPGEPNSVAALSEMRTAAEKRDIKVVDVPVPRLPDILSAGNRLAGRVDAIYIPTDNMIVSGVESVLKVAYDNQIPVFSADTDSVKRGTAASMGFNYKAMGVKTGHMIARVLEGADASAMPVELTTDLNLHLNIESAARMGLTFPSDMVNQATVKFE